MERIYLDHAATTPMHPRVIEKMMEAMNIILLGIPQVFIHLAGKHVTILI